MIKSPQVAWTVILSSFVILMLSIFMPTRSGYDIVLIVFQTMLALVVLLSVAVPMLKERFPPVSLDHGSASLFSRHASGSTQDRVFCDSEIGRLMIVSLFVGTYVVSRRISRSESLFVYVVSESLFYVIWIVLGSAVTTYFIRSRRLRNRLRREQCLGCGYSLPGAMLSKRVQCPKCGGWQKEIVAGTFRYTRD